MSLANVVLAEIVVLWFSWMVAMSWQVLILVALLLAVGYLLRKQSARLRYGLWMLVPIRLVVPPTLALMTCWAWWVLPETQKPVGPDSAVLAQKQPEPDDSDLGRSQTFSQRGRDEADFRRFESSREPDAATFGFSAIPSAKGEASADSVSHRVETAESIETVANDVRMQPSEEPGVAPAAVGPATMFSLDSLGRTAQSWSAVMFGLWLAGVGVYAIRTVVGYRQVRRWVKSSVAASQGNEKLLADCCEQVGLRWRVQIRLSSSIWTPLVTGIVRPIILLPEVVVQTLSPAELKAVLLHELQHVVRRDLWQELGLTVIQALYFFHPAVWLAVRQLRRLREQACDEATVAALDGRRADYGSGFVKVAELLVRQAPQLTLGIVDSDEQASSRLRRILDPNLRIGRNLSWPAIAFIVLAGFVLIPSGARTNASADENTLGGTEVASGSTAPDGAAHAETSRMETTVAGSALDGSAMDNQGWADGDEDIPVIGDADIEPYLVTGKVLNVSGQPASNSTIVFTVYSTKKHVGNTLTVTTNDAGEFRVWMRHEKNNLPYVRTMAMNADKSEMGAFRFPWAYETSIIEPITIQLARTRTVRVKVIDSEGAPIENAYAVIGLAYPQNTKRVQTNQEGIAAFVIPENERIESAAAWKDQAGADYRHYTLSREQVADANAKAPEFPAENLETLKLESAAPITVTVTDDDGKPLEGVAIEPWLLKKTSEPEDLNLSLFQSAFGQQTATDGTATFAWMPSWQTNALVFWPRAEGLVWERAIYEPGTNAGQFKITLKRLVPIRGTVRTADGVPASGVLVQASGRGYGDENGSDTTKSGADGRYELLVNPDQIYLVVASSEGFASAPQTGFAVYPNQPVEGKDFTLRKATRIHGRLVDEADQSPIAGAPVVIDQKGQDLHSMTGVSLPNPEQDNRSVCPRVSHVAKTDADGRFEMFVGDGTFYIATGHELMPPDEFDIEGDAEREFLVTTKITRKVELRGVVRDSATGQPFENARVVGIPRNFMGWDWRANTTSTGEFVVQQDRGGVYIHAESPDRTLGAIVEVSEDRTSVELNLQPVGKASGRLLTFDTKEPWGKQKIIFAVQIPSENDRTWRNGFGGEAITNDDGTFELSGLVPGREYALLMESRPDGSVPRLGTVTIAPGQTVNLGDVSPPKPYAPPTLDERIQSAFDVATTPVERHAKALHQISLVNQHLLVVFGEPTNQSVYDLMKVRFEDADFRPLSDEFRFMPISTEEDHMPSAQELATQLNESLGADRGGFVLVLLNASGEKVDSIDAKALSPDGAFSKERFLTWLTKHQPTPLDARKLLDDALALAKKENKRVLVQETATWCGPCHMLTRFLKANPVWETDYILVKMDHRHTNAQELMQELRDGADGGIPWFAILDTDGKKLATSNDPSTSRNIGFPSEESGRVHFEHMLRTTRQRLTDEEINSLIDDLKSGN